MTENFNFYGQTTFINRPASTVIKDFQNSYSSPDDPSKAEVYQQLAQLVELVLRSQQLPDQDKEDAVSAIHDAADHVKNDSQDQNGMKALFTKIKAIVTKAADIVGPAVTLLSSVTTIIGLV